jgi:hypothetical protein
MKVNTGGMIRAIINAINIKLETLSANITTQMKMNIDEIPIRGNHFAVGKPEWRQSVKSNLKHRLMSDTYTSIIEMGLFDVDELTLNRALLINYGMGKTLSSINPYLQEYLNSIYYDDNRGGYEVYARPGELVYDYYSGTWIMSKADPKLGHIEITSFWLHASYFYEHAVIEILPQLNYLLDEVINDIDLSSYVVT